MVTVVDPEICLGGVPNENTLKMQLMKPLKNLVNKIMKGVFGAMVDTS